MRRDCRARFGPLGHGDRLAGQGGLGDFQRVGRQQAGVGGDAGAGAQHEHVAEHDVAGRDGLHAAVAEHPRRRGGHALQRLGGLADLPFLPDAGRHVHADREAEERGVQRLAQDQRHAGAAGQQRRDRRPHLISQRHDQFFAVRRGRRRHAPGEGVGRAEGRPPRRRRHAAPPRWSVGPSARGADRRDSRGPSVAGRRREADTSCAQRHKTGEVLGHHLPRQGPADPESSRTRRSPATRSPERWRRAWRASGTHPASSRSATATRSGASRSAQAGKAPLWPLKRPMPRSQASKAAAALAPSDTTATILP